MTLVHTDNEIYIKFKENRVNVLVIENSKMMGEVVNELYNQCNGIEGNFIIAENDRLLKFTEKVIFITEPFSISCNSKKILTLLYKELEDEAKNSMYEETNVLNSEIVKYIENIISKLPYPITFSDDFNINSIFKLVNVCLDDYCESICEKIINYIKIVSSLSKINTIIFLNLKSFVTIEEIKEIYKIAFYNKINILLIENYIYDKIEYEDVIVYDKDLCKIMF